MVDIATFGCKIDQTFIVIKKIGWFMKWNEWMKPAGNQIKFIF